MIQGLNFVLNHVDDIVAARAFYTEKMGFAVERDAPDFVQFRQPGGAAYAISKATPTEQGTELWWFVDNADQTHATLTAQGVQTIIPPHDEPFGRAFTIKDLAGNTLNMLQLPAQG